MQEKTVIINEIEVNYGDSREKSMHELSHRDISEIAVAALFNSDQNLNAGHAHIRRYGVDEMLALLSTLEGSEKLSILPIRVGKTYLGAAGSFRNTTQIMSDQLNEQKFLRKKSDQLAFITNRFKGVVEDAQLNINLPLWVIGIGQVALAERYEKAVEIETVIDEMGWEVALLAMASSGMNESEILNTFNHFSRDYQAAMPKKDWFKIETDTNRFNYLAGFISRVPKWRGLKVNYDELSEMEERLDTLRNNPHTTYNELNDRLATVEILADLVFILPSEHEAIIHSLVHAGNTKEEIHTILENMSKTRLQGTRENAIDRFVTLYPDIKSANFYPDTRY